jgi:ParB family chromosome partitioning protein
LLDLSLAEEPKPTTGPLEGRSRLAGAYSIDVSRIQPDPKQPRRRLEAAAQADLVASVRQLGILQPVTVRFLESENIYQIVTGERRYRAAKEAGLTEIPCWIQTPKEEDVLVHQIVEN